MEERLEAAVSQVEVDGKKWHNIIHGDENTVVPTENGDVPTVAKQLKDIRDNITGGVSDVVAEAERARDEAILAKNDTFQLKDDVIIIKSDMQILKNDTLDIKSQAEIIFNNISSETNKSIQNIQNETALQISAIHNNGNTEVEAVNLAGTTQISNIGKAAEEQIALAESHANQAKYYAESAAPAPLGSRLSVPGNKKVPDGYEPVWYKNTITRTKYPDFFAQLVDTNYLVFTDEATYDSQVSNYGMCGSYVKIDENTVILPLLKNYARSGTLENIGTILDDQFQGHYHSNQIRTDAYGTGDGPAITATASADEALQKNGKNMYVLEPKTDGINGIPRYGSETRPKSYYELVYIKCADICRPLSEEDTTELRNTLINKVDTDLGNITSALVNAKIFLSAWNDACWYERNQATGLIKQGGKVMVNTNADFPVKFPIAFSAAPLMVLLTPYNQPTNYTSDYNYLAVAVNISTTAFSIRYRDSDDIGCRQGIVSWFAVGY